MLGLHCMLLYMTTNIMFYHDFQQFYEFLVIIFLKHVTSDQPDQETCALKCHYL